MKDGVWNEKFWILQLLHETETFIHSTIGSSGLWIPPSTQPFATSVTPPPWESLPSGSNFISLIQILKNRSEENVWVKKYTK